jgi:hypothetical protein
VLSGAALLLSLALGWLTVRLLLNRRTLAPSWQRILLEAAAAVGVAAGLTSVLYFLLLLAGFATPWSSLVALVLLLGILAYLLARRKDIAVKQEEPRLTSGSWIWAVRMAFIAAVGLIAFELIRAYAAERHGWWDAFSIWNLRARFLASGQPAWRGIFSADLNAGLTGASHPGYPILLSGWIASIWMASGGTAAWVPAAVGALFCFGTLFLLAGAVGTLRGEMAGLSAGLVLAATSSYVAQSAWQVADIPLGFFILGGTAMLALAQRNSAGAAVLSGLLAGFAPWTKNEGWPFLLVLVPVAFWMGGRRTGLFVTAGALPGAVITILFKLLVGGGSESAFPRTAMEVISPLADPSRWGVVASSFGQAFAALGPVWAHPVLLLALLAYALRLAPGRVRLLGLAAPALAVLASCFGMLLVTRADLAWQTSTSVHRLILQPWPAFLLVAFMALRPVEETLAPAAPADTSAAQRGKKKKRKSRS